MQPLTQCQQRCALVSAIAFSLATLPAHAGDLTGPGTTHTINAGDASELWTVSDRAELIIAPGGATSGVDVDNATVTGTDVDMRGLAGVRIANGGSGSLNGGRITIAAAVGSAGGVSSGSTLDLDALTVTSAGRGFSATGAGSVLTVRDTVVTTANEAFQVATDARLVLDGVRATSDGTGTGGIGWALQMAGGSAQVTNSVLDGVSGAVQMTGGTLAVVDSQLQSVVTALTLAGGGAGTPPTASVSGTSVVTGTIGASITGGSTLTVSGATLRGTGTGGSGGNGAGATVNNSTLVLRQGATVEGTAQGLYLSGPASGTSTVTIDASTVRAASGPAIAMPLAGNADITVSNGATLSGGNGMLLDIGARASANLAVTGSALVGDIVGQVQGPLSATLNVRLDQGASLLGAIRNGTDLQLADARWQLTADSNVQHLTVGSGATVALGDGSAFHTLNVAGDYVGNGGTLLFNTVLAGDDAGSDALVIGGDTSGQSFVAVNNVGGAGALTDQGISLIQVAGASNGIFELSGRAVAGNHEYFLHKGAADGGWYLRSELPVPADPCELDPSLPQCPGTQPVPNPDPDPDPCDLNPALPGCPGTDPDPDPDPEPVPVLRPEPGAYLANLQAAEHMFRLGYHARQDGQNGGRVWARVDGSRSGFAADSEQLRVRGSSQSLSIGAQLWGTPGASGVGMMLASGNASSTSISELTGYDARGKVKGNAVGVYGTWRAGHAGDAYAGLYLDASLQRAVFRNEVHGVALPTERYDSKAWQGAMEVGYAIPLSHTPGSTVFVEPNLQLGHTHWDDQPHTERNGTVVRSEDASGSFGRIGLRLSGVTRWAGKAAEIQPYLAANYLRSAANPYVRMNDEAVDARIPRERGEVSAGASLRFSNGFGAWGGLSLQSGAGYHQRTAQLGLSYRW